MGPGMAGTQSGGELLHGGPTGCTELSGGRRKRGTLERSDGKRDVLGGRISRECIPRGMAGGGAGTAVERTRVGSADIGAPLVDRRERGKSR